MARRKIPQARLTSDSRLVLRQNGSNHMNASVNVAVSRSAEKDKKREWSGRIKPSAWTFDVCIETYQDTCHIQFDYKLALRLKFLYGNAIHHWIGQFLVDNYPELYVKPVNLNEAAERWYYKAKPEVPIVSEKWLCKAIMDFPARFKGSIWIVDWKTTWIEEKQWNDFLVSPVVDDKYIFQGASYCFLAEEENVFGEVPTHFGLCYINMKEDPEDMNMWKEVYWEYAPFREMTALVWGLLREATEAKLAGGRVFCKNPYCGTHGHLNWSKQEEKLDPWKPRVPLTARELDYGPIRSNVFLDRARNTLEDVRTAQDISGDSR